MSASLRHTFVKYAPDFLLKAVQRFLKSSRRKALAQQAAKGNVITEQMLISDLKKIGLKTGDAVLVHCSFSKIGFVEGGPATLINALENVTGPEGTLLMPAFPATGRNRDYLEMNPVFDVRNTPSRMGIVSEFFRKLPGTFRSLHPTDSVIARGKDAEWFVAGHFGELRPHGINSPFRRLCTRNGKILMLGTTLNGACTNLHTLEDAFDRFLYPVYDNKLYETTVVDVNGIEHKVKTFVHNPDWSVKRNCDALKPIFIRNGVLTDGVIGKAQSMLIDAEKMLDVMISEYQNKGVTMYTPDGGPLPEIQ
jgi:aminoglycoside 3-N-acetyltransferase